MIIQKAKCDTSDKRKIKKQHNRNSRCTQKGTLRKESEDKQNNQNMFKVCFAQR